MKGGRKQGVGTTIISRAWWEYQTRIQEGWSEWIATWISEAEEEDDLTCVDSVQGGRPPRSPEQPQPKEDKPTHNESGREVP